MMVELGSVDSSSQAVTVCLVVLVWCGDGCVRVELEALQHARYAMRGVVKKHVLVDKNCGYSFSWFPASSDLAPFLQPTPSAITYTHKLVRD